jgi:hypothetical protein
MAGRYSGDRFSDSIVLVDVDARRVMGEGKARDFRFSKPSSQDRKAY